MTWYAPLVCLCFAALPGLGPVAGQSDADLSSSSSLNRRLFAENGFDVESAMTAAAVQPSNDNGTATAEKTDVFRLPTDVLPVSYSLEVDTDFQNNFTYAGRVDIVVSTTARTCRITMNSKDLRVTKVVVTDPKTNLTLPVVEYYLVDKNEQLVIAFNATVKCLLAFRSYVVTVLFDAHLRNDMSGYYRSSYKENGITKWLAVTKFEPTHARKAFPCFDEPALKTPFKISIKRRSDQISLSNMPLLNSSKIEQSNMYWDYFQDTPPMSTYLVAFFVGEFYAMKTLTIGIYTHKSYVNQAKYIADKSSKLLDAMENFTGVDYKLPKLDLLAIPDFSSGAMENWGLNTYRERFLLVAENSKTKIKEFVTTVVQHELSHQWFGNLVTCAWWDYLWLNEGFATFFEYLATKNVEPKWRLEDVFVYEVHQAALEYDQTPTHPITGSVQSPKEIYGMFDDISYSKAGAVLRMLMYVVTENNFKKALNFYLKANEFRAVTPENLWTAFENVLYNEEFELDGNVTVTEFMESWTEQTGYPLVTVTRVNNSFVATQERFLLCPYNNIVSTELYVVGLTYTTENKKNFNNVLPKMWLTRNEMVFPNQNETGWYIFNLQSIGFYRVNYDKDNWNALVEQLYKDCNAIHVLNRAQIIDDSFNLAKANRLNYTFVLDMTKYLENESDTIPWYSARAGFAYLLNRMRCDCRDNYLKTYVNYLAGIIYTKIERLVVNDNVTDHNVMTSWNSFSHWACSLDNDYCTKSAMSYFKKWRQGEKIPADIKDAAFCVGVKYGDSKVWNAVLNVYVNSDSVSDRQSAQLALACSKDTVQLSKYLDFMFLGYDGPIRPQDFRVIYQSLALTSEGISVLINFLTTKLNRIINEVINGEQIVRSIYSILTSKVVHNSEIKQIDALRTDSTISSQLQKAFNSSFIKVEHNLQWFMMHHLEIVSWVTATVDELGLIVETGDASTSEPESSTPKESETSVDESESSGAPFTKVQAFVLVLFAVLSLKWLSNMSCSL